ncbi:MAG: hypothetical protein NUV54_02030 [Candidatus Taylorbacteria bacterium]|nr:hypothetical protein [Candidatus Taylorbacteria bacterium]
MSGERDGKQFDQLQAEMVGRREQLEPQALSAIVGIFTIHERLAVHFPSSDTVIELPRVDTQGRTIMCGDLKVRVCERLKALQSSTEDLETFKASFQSTFPDAELRKHIVETALHEGFEDYFGAAIHGRRGQNISDVMGGRDELPLAINVRTTARNILTGLNSEIDLEMQEPVLSATGSL